MALPTLPKKRRKRYASGHDRRGQIPQRRSILEQPEAVEQRAHIGHWEGDTVIGAAHQHAIVTLVEIQSGFAVVTKVERKTSEKVSAAIIKRHEPIAKRVKTITFDNGKEYAGHRQIDESLGSTAYFAEPFASRQRKSNENFNWLLRQHIPKKRRSSTVCDRELKMFEDLLNHRPRKRLGFKNVPQVFHESLKRVELRN
jgi:IS30 family transposase